MSTDITPEMTSENRDCPSLLRNVILVLAIYSYFMGWVHTYYLFKHFGISLHSVEIPFYYFFVYSYPVISSSYTILIVIVTAAAILSVSFFWLVPYRPIVLGAVLILLLADFFFIARDTAEEDAKRLRTGIDAKTIVFTFKKDLKSVYPKSFMKANSEKELKLLTHTSDMFYVFSQPPGEKILS